MNWLDLLFILIIILSTFKGLRGGFLSGVAGIAGLLGGIWTAVHYHEHLASYLSERWGWGDKISGYLSSQLQQDYLPGEGILQAVVSPSAVVNSFLPAINSTTNSILNIVAFGLIVIAVYIFLGVIFRLISRAVSQTPLSLLDKIAGCILGFAKGILFASIILVILLSFKVPLALLSSSEGQGAIALAINKSELTPYLLNLINALNLPLPVPNVNMAAIWGINSVSLWAIL